MPSIIILNGVPRSGKSSIAQVILETFPGKWANLGVDYCIEKMAPSELKPGIGLRPGGERPDLEPTVRRLYRELNDLVVAEVEKAVNVVMDVGYHTWYAEAFDPYREAMERFKGLSVLFVGVRCPIEIIMERRSMHETGYLRGTDEDPFPEPVRRWQEAVHLGRVYDLEVDTSVMSPEECVAGIANLLGA